MTSSLDAAVAAFAEEVGDADPVTVTGLGSRGGPVPDVRTVAAPSGIDWIQPAEMTICCGAGTPVADVDAALAEHGQCVALQEGGTIEIGKIWARKLVPTLYQAYVGCTLYGALREFPGPICPQSRIQNHTSNIRSHMLLVRCMGYIAVVTIIRPKYCSHGAVLPTCVFTWVLEGSLAGNCRAGFRSIFGQTWPQNPSRTTGLVLQCQLHQQSAPQTTSKPMSWCQKNIRPDCLQVPRSRLGELLARSAPFRDTAPKLPGPRPGIRGEPGIFG